MKPFLVYLLITFYVFAGINHFWHARFYYTIIPPYLQQWSYQLNIIVGITEIMLGIGFVFSNTRKLAAIGIILMLLAFIPAHIYFIQMGSCVPKGLCIPQWVGWARLLFIHPILIAWGWHCRQ